MSHSFVGVRICGRYHRDLFLSQAFDRWTLISPCWPRGHVFSGLERCSHCRPSIFGSWVHTNTRKKLVFVWRPYDGYIVTSPENTYPRGKHEEIKVHRSNACDQFHQHQQTNNHLPSYLNSLYTKRSQQIRLESQILAWDRHNNVKTSFTFLPNYPYFFQCQSKVTLTYPFLHFYILSSFHILLNLFSS